MPNLPILCVLCLDILSDSWLSAVDCGLCGFLTFIKTVWMWAQTHVWTNPHKYNKNYSVNPERRNVPTGFASHRLLRIRIAFARELIGPFVFICHLEHNFLWKQWKHVSVVIWPRDTLNSIVALAIHNFSFWVRRQNPQRTKCPKLYSKLTNLKHQIWAATLIFSVAVSNFFF